MSTAPDVLMAKEGDDVAIGSSCALTEAALSKGIECPDLDQVFSTLALSPMGLVVEESEPVPLEDQQSLLTSLQESLRKAEERCTIEAFIDDEKILYKLWKCRTKYLLPAAEALANGSRNGKAAVHCSHCWYPNRATAPWRVLYGQAGILDFFLRLVASTEAIDDDLLLQALRLVGNSCADTSKFRVCPCHSVV